MARTPEAPTPAARTGARTIERTPTIPVTELEQSAFCRTDDDLRSRPLEQELKANVRWQRIPSKYLQLTADELTARINDARLQLGKPLVILGHHYQREEIIQFADLRGDSYKLSQYAAAQPQASHILFCGVHFMAETARILCDPAQKVLMPNLAAGCSMADMAPTDDVRDAWSDLSTLLGEGGIIPITYMNSTAAIKALTGEHGGIVCTSSNAKQAFQWAMARGERVLFLPDQHLGRNSAFSLGIPLSDMLVWNPFKPLGGHTEEQLRAAKVLLWQGHCSVHTRFTPKLVQQARARYPNVKILVHPECTMETVQLADHVGSTEYIAKMIHESKPGSVWGVGTEVSLVSRLAKENPDKNVFCLDPIVCPCSTMYRIHPAYVSWVLDELLDGRVVNEITVDETIAKYAKVALDRMLALPL